MNILQKCLECIIYSSLFVGFVGAAMVLTTSLLLNLSVSIEMLLIIFLISFAVYNINRKTDVPEDRISHPTRTVFIIAYYKYLKLIATISYITGCILSFSKNIQTGIIALLPLIFVVLYSMRWIPKKSISRLKDIFLIKNFTVAFAWAIVVTLLPIAYFEKDIQISAMFIFLFIFMKVFGNTVTFDVRDVPGDKLSGIRTIPIKIGVEKTKHLLTIVNIFSFLSIVIPAFLGFLPHSAYIISITCVYTQFYINSIGKLDIKFLTDILADGEYIVMGLLALIGTSVTYIWL